VINAVNRLAAAGDDLSVSSVARAARVHRSFIYRHSDLHAAVHHQAARDTTPSDGTRASRQALQADLANALERSTRQTQRISRLEKTLSHLLGDNAWRESGLGAPTDIDALQQRITSQEQQLGDVAAQLAAREDDLGAARNASREFMAQLNHREN
jgi:chromosome segregation ATPase